MLLTNILEFKLTIDIFADNEFVGKSFQCDQSIN